MKLACRHHVYEVILRSVFELKFGETTGPNVLLFKEYLGKWDEIDQTKYKLGIQDSIVKRTLCNISCEIIKFCKNKLKELIVRSDYKELLQLTLIFFGDGSDSGNIAFPRPGAMHHARFMSKAIYSLKIFMFASVFKLTSHQKSSVRYFCMFVVQFYVKAWFGCTNALAAPKQDLNFIKSINIYSKIDFDIFITILNKISKILWYLYFKRLLSKKLRNTPVFSSSMFIQCI